MLLAGSFGCRLPPMVLVDHRLAARCFLVSAEPCGIRGLILVGRLVLSRVTRREGLCRRLTVCLFPFRLNDAEVGRIASLASVSAASYEDEREGLFLSPTGPVFPSRLGSSCLSDRARIVARSTPSASCRQ